MNALLKVAEQYSPSDALFDPPIARDKEERRAQAKGTLGGAASGALIGAAGNYYLGDQRDSNVARIVQGGYAGMFPGLVAGGALGNRKVHKKRNAEGEGDSEEEEKMKMRRSMNNQRLPA